jgi:hypothetical protein
MPMRLALPRRHALHCLAYSPCLCALIIRDAYEPCVRPLPMRIAIRLAYSPCLCTYPIRLAYPLSLYA